MSDLNAGRTSRLSSKLSFLISYLLTWVLAALSETLQKKSYITVRKSLDKSSFPVQLITNRLALPHTKHG